MNISCREMAISFRPQCVNLFLGLIVNMLVDCEGWCLHVRGGYDWWFYTRTWTFWPLGKVSLILKTVYFYTFLWLTGRVLQQKMHWEVFLSISLTSHKHCLISRRQHCLTTSSHYLIWCCINSVVPYWGQDKMATNFLTTISKAFWWMKMSKFG